MAGAELIVIAVKPQDIEVLLEEIGGLLTPAQTVLLCAAAIPTAYIEARIAEDVPVVRAMPNAPSTVHEGMAGICAGAHAGETQLALAEEALQHLGRVVRVPEARWTPSPLSPAPVRVLRAAGRGDDRGRHPARRLARDLHHARRPDDA